MLVLTAAGGSLVLSRAFTDAWMPQAGEFNLHRLPPPSLSLDVPPYTGPDGTLG
jgi:hypothetical protein